LGSLTHAVLQFVITEPRLNGLDKLYAINFLILCTMFYVESYEPEAATAESIKDLWSMTRY
jgi:hypothetical protein